MQHVFFCIKDNFFWVKIHKAKMSERDLRARRRAAAASTDSRPSKYIRKAKGENSLYVVGRLNEDHMYFETTTREVYQIEAFGRVEAVLLDYTNGNLSRQLQSILYYAEDAKLAQVDLNRSFPDVGSPGDLSAFGRNEQSKFYNISLVGGSAHVLRVMLLGAMNAYAHLSRIRWNVALRGSGDKFNVFSEFEKIMIPGTVNNYTYTTAKAIAAFAVEDSCDAITIMRDADVNSPIMKDLLSSFATKEELVASGTFMMATNDFYFIEDAIKRRFYSGIVTPEGGSSSTTRDTKEKQEMFRIGQHKLQWMHALVRKLIMCNVMLRVSTFVSKKFFGHIMKFSG